MRQKYSKEPTDPKLARWADETIQALLATPGQPRHIPLRTTDPQRARAIKNALYAARDRYNKHRGDDEQISPSANLADLDTGKCRNCEEMGCDPSEPGVHTIHVGLFTKHEGRARQGRIPRDQWAYDGSQGRPRRQAPSEPEPVSRPGHRFGAAQRPAEPDPPPAGPALLLGAPKPEPRKPQPKDGKRPEPKDSKKPEPEGESVFTRFRRSLG